MTLAAQSKGDKRQNVVDAARIELVIKQFLQEREAHVFTTTFEDLHGLAQAGLSLPAFGTPHADYFYGEIPCSLAMHDAEIREQYEWQTGAVRAETLQAHQYQPEAMPGILVNAHGPFTWGKDPVHAVKSAIVLEEIAYMARFSQQLQPRLTAMQATLLDKHYLRKHDKHAYYGER